MTAMDNPGLVMARLQEIETDLEERQNEYEDAARERAKLIRDWEFRMAVALRKAQGSDANARKASALVTAVEMDDLYDRLAEAEGAYDGLKSVVKVLETRASIGQSILRAQGRS